jgi:hypothetical protein
VPCAHKQVARIRRDREWFFVQAKKFRIHY